MAIFSGHNRATMRARFTVRLRVVFMVSFLQVMNKLGLLKLTNQQSEKCRTLLQFAVIKSVTFPEAA